MNTGKNIKSTISVSMTALNEEDNIEAAVTNTLKAFDDFGIDGEVVVINDGSTDKTGEIAKKISQTDKRVNIVTHAKPMGVGASFWDGVDAVKGDVVVWLPGDNENNPWEIFKYHALLDHVDLVIPFIYNKEVRSAARNALSFLYTFIVNSVFLTNFNYTNGTTLYRKSALKQLKRRSTGFFFQTDIIMRLAKKGYLFSQVPCSLGVRREGSSKAVSVKSLRQITFCFLKLFWDVYIAKTEGIRSEFTKDSKTFLIKIST
ncbi:glycosyltransferase family 2 protein [Elusimicrobiota bacterium]